MSGGSSVLSLQITSIQTEKPETLTLRLPNSIQEKSIMQAANAHPTRITQNTTCKFIFTAIIPAVILLLAIFFVINGFRVFQNGSLPRGTVVISQRTLEEKYGLRVNLLAVTAAGGFVDVRFKIVDGEKLKQLLADEKNFPVLRNDKGVILNAPAETKSQKVEFVSGGNLFIIYPNSVNAIKQNTSVMIIFGNIAVGPIQAK
jgi:hypothetical protein